jgi:hypothetical protein
VIGLFVAVSSAKDHRVQPVGHVNLNHLHRRQFSPFGNNYAWMPSSLSASFHALKRGALGLKDWIYLKYQLNFPSISQTKKYCERHLQECFEILETNGDANELGMF